MSKKVSTMFKEIIDMADCLGQYEMGWLDYPDNTIGRTNFYRELDHDIASKIGISPNCYSSFYLEQQDRLKKAQKALYDLGNKLSRKGLVDFLNY